MDAAIIDFGQEYNIDPGIVQAILCVENRDLKGLDYMDRPRIRFELHVFEGRHKASNYGEFFRIGPKRYFDHYYKLGNVESYVHSSQENEHVALSIARVLDDFAALESIGIGVGQIMGFNYASVGYESAYDMYFAAFDESNQYKMFTEFLKTKTGLIAALSSLDYTKITTIYNGTGNIEAYKKKLIECHNKFK